MSRRLQAGPYIIRLIGTGHLDGAYCVTARYDLDATVDAMVKPIDRTDGRITVKPDYRMGAGDGQPGRGHSALIGKGGDWPPRCCSEEVVCCK